MTTAPTRAHNRSAHERRLRFAVLVKVLFKLIDDTLVRDQAKSVTLAVIKDCRIGHPKLVSLIDALEFPLRELVGDSLWVCACHYTELYFSRKDVIRESALRRRLEVGRQLSHLEMLLERRSRSSLLKHRHDQYGIPHPSSDSELNPLSES
jgi:hypothetical protein